MKNQSPSQLTSVNLKDEVSFGSLRYKFSSYILSELFLVSLRGMMVNTETASDLFLRENVVGSLQPSQHLPIPQLNTYGSSNCYKIYFNQR